jgi:hypothetical protein
MFPAALWPESLTIRKLRLNISLAGSATPDEKSRAASPATWGAAIDVPESATSPPLGVRETISTPGA